MKKLDAIVFDLDDTLYPEREYVLSGFKEVANITAPRLSITKETAYRELERIFLDGIRGDTFNRWLEMHQMENQEMITLCVAAYRNHIPVISPFPETVQLLNDLKNRYKIGLVSDGFYEVQKKKISALGIGKYFDSVVFSDEFGREFWKPSTKPFETVLHNLDCLPNKSIYVADNSNKDFFAPRRMGMGTIRIKRSNGEYANIEPVSEDFRADITIESLSDILQFLEHN